MKKFNSYFFRKFQKKASPPHLLLYFSKRASPSRYYRIVYAQ